MGRPLESVIFPKSSLQKLAPQMLNRSSLISVLIVTFDGSLDNTLKLKMSNRKMLYKVS